MQLRSKNQDEGRRKSWPWRVCLGWTHSHEQIWAHYRAAWHLCVFTACWYMHPSLQGKHGILIRLVTVDCCHGEDFDLRFTTCSATVSKQCFLRHPIICMTTAVPGRNWLLIHHIYFVTFFQGPLRKLEDSPAELAWASCFTRTTNVVQM